MKILCILRTLKFNITKIIKSNVKNSTRQEQWNCMLLFYFDFKSVQQVSLFLVDMVKNFNTNRMLTIH